MKLKKLDFFLALIFFLTFFYVRYGCTFGKGNNIEELPVIYKKAGFFEYRNDPFVTASVDRFNAISIFTSTYALAAKITGYKSFRYVYLVSHLMALIFVYLGFRKIFQALSKKPISEYFILLTILGALFIDRELLINPNHRMLFWPYFDPEFLVLPFLLGSIAFYIRREHDKAAILLLVGTLIHPLFTLPIAGAFMLGLIILEHDKSAIANACKYLLSAFPFSLFLFFFSRSQEQSVYDPSLLHELVRAPHHLTIPTVATISKTPYLQFFGIVFTFLILSSFLIYFKKRPSFKKNGFYVDKDWSGTYLYTLVCILTLGLIIVSLIASTQRVNLLVQLTPYRISVTVIALSYLIFMYAMSQYAPKIKGSKIILPAILVLSLSVVIFISINYKTNPNTSHKVDLIDWVKDSTSENSLFLNYSDIDVRTNCGRSDFFRFKTIPVYSDAQVEWYQRLLIFYGLKNKIDGKEYEQVRQLIKSKDITINLKEVMQQTSNQPIDYLLVSNFWKDKFEYISMSPVFSNSHYAVYDLNQRTQESFEN